MKCRQKCYVRFLEIGDILWSWWSNKREEWVSKDCGGARPARKCLSLDFAYVKRKQTLLKSHCYFEFLSHACIRALSVHSCPTLCNPVDSSPPGSSVHGFSRQEYWSGLPCPPPGDLPDPEIEPVSSALQADSLPTEPPEALLSHITKANPMWHAQKWNNSILSKRLLSTTRYSQDNIIFPSANPFIHPSFNLFIT